MLPSRRPFGVQPVLVELEPLRQVIENRLMQAGRQQAADASLCHDEGPMLEPAAGGGDPRRRQGPSTWRARQEPSGHRGPLHHRSPDGGPAANRAPHLYRRTASRAVCGCRPARLRGSAARSGRDWRAVHGARSGGHGPRADRRVRPAVPRRRAARRRARARGGPRRRLGVERARAGAPRRLLRPPRPDRRARPAARRRAQARRPRRRARSRRRHEEEVERFGPISRLLANVNTPEDSPG